LRANTRKRRRTRRRKEKERKGKESPPLHSVFPSVFSYQIELVVFLSIRICVTSGIGIRLMFWNKRETFRNLTQTKFADFDPVFNLWRGHQCLQVVSSKITRTKKVRS
jgi:hypothetical protein